MSTPTPTPAPKPRLKLLPDWKRLPGTARNYQNVRTGETLSRRQYDQRHGLIARSGFKSDYQKRKAEKTKWHSFYVEHFPVTARSGEAKAWEKLLARIRELGHRRMFVSARGEAGLDYPQGTGMVWVSTTGFIGSEIFRRTITDFASESDVPGGLTERTYSSASVWLTEQLYNGGLMQRTVTEYILRWQA